VAGVLSATAIIDRFVASSFASADRIALACFQCYPAALNE
jgi:hypothetical protein